MFLRLSHLLLPQFLSIIITVLFLLFLLHKVTNFCIYDFVFNGSLRKHVRASPCVHNVGCVGILAGSIFEFPSQYGFHWMEQLCTYLPWDDTESRWT